MRLWRRKAAPAAPQRMSVAEARCAAAWGYTEQGWYALTDTRRQYCRDNITSAPRFVS